MLQLPYIRSEIQQEDTYFVEGLETRPRVGNWTIFLTAGGICGMARNYVLQCNNKDLLVSSPYGYTVIP